MMGVLQFIHQIAPPDGNAAATDGELLERFVSYRDENAFTMLLRRHGPLVFAVCRRVLPHAPDAEDVFQATFLVLASNARSIAKRESIASWLHGVARRIALRAKADLAKRRVRHRQTSLLVAPDSLDELVRHDLRAILDEEVARLPAKYRDAFILCYLEGKTNDEAARLLGRPRGTVSSRLVRAREILRARLTRRGLALSAAFATCMLPRATAAAVVPRKLVGATLRAALQLRSGSVTDVGLLSVRVVTLTEGALKGMAMTKFKIAALFMSLGVALAGAGVVTINQDGAAPPLVVEDGGKTGVPGERAKPRGLDQEPDQATGTSRVQQPDPAEKYLRSCAQRLAKLDSLTANIERTSVDKTFEVTEVSAGTLKYLKPNRLMMELLAQGNSKRFEKFIWSDKLLYEYSPTQKEIRIHELPPPGPSERELPDGPLGVAFSWLMKPDPLPRSPVQDTDKTKPFLDYKLVKEDQWYVYIEIQPRTPETKHGCTKARIVLTKPTSLPRQVWYEWPNGNEVKWDFTRIEENVALPQKEFTSPQVPPGWILRRVAQGVEGPLLKEPPRPTYADKP